MFGRCALVALALVLAPLGRGVAQQRPLADAVSLANADACVVGEPLVAAAAEWLGRDTVDARIAVLVDLAPDASAAAVIAIRDGERVAVRRFDPLPAACADRRTVLSLGVALAIDALLLDALETPVATPAPEPAPVRPPAQSIAIELAGEGGLVIGSLDALAGIGAATLSLALPPLVRLRAGAMASSIGSFALGAGAVDTSLVVGRLDVCLVATVDVLELDGCVGVLAGAALATGRDYARVRSAAQPWIGAAPRVEAAVWVLDPLALTLAVDGLFAFAPPTFSVLDGNGDILHTHALPIAGLAVSAGLRVRFR